MPSNHKELVEELNRHKAEASKLREKLNGLDKEKESWFGKKEAISAKIREAIQKIRGSKAKRDSLTLEVKALKTKRDGVNNALKLKLSELGKSKKENSEIAKSSGIKEPPSRIMQQIEKLEFRIETDTVSFEKEKELMKKIKQLKRSYEDAADLMESNKKVRDASDDARKLRKEANEIHRQIQDKAGQSQVLHEDMIKISGEIDKMKAEEEEAFRKFSELKKQFHEVNGQLKEKLNVMNGISSQLDKMHSDRREKRRQEQELFLKSKEEEVNQKIKRGEKLTTEDLLVFQKFGRE